jgi:hypothetical protein
MDLRAELAAAIGGSPAPPPDASRETRKNYTELLSRRITEVIKDRILSLGLSGVRAPHGRDKQFMGGYGTKGVDAYLSDEKHGLLLSSGTKGIVFNIPKNLKNRYRDMVMEALELHKRFPYAVCGHLLFLGKTESARSSVAFGTVLGEVAVLLQGIVGRQRPDEAAEVYEAMGVVLFDPGDPETLDLAPAGLPEGLHGISYCERLVTAFHARNPFFHQ